jgi:ADP-ribosylglycohydrolase
MQQIHARKIGKWQWQAWEDPEQLEGGLIGLLVGDALGVPYEFHPPDEIPSMDLIEFNPPPGFRRAHPGVPPGTWSDDGAQALILLDSLLACDGLDLDHFARGLRRWLMEGFFAVNRSVFDIGAQTSTALNRLGMGVSPEASGPSEERHNGNGSLMRVLPLALWHRGRDRELMQLAARQSLPTHGHARARIACALYCLWARVILEQGTDPWDEAMTRFRAQGGLELFPVDEAEQALDPHNAKSVKGTGYVVDTLWSARAAVEGTTNYEDCVRHAIALGHDTDTTAAVAGGIAGLLYGIDGIPARWRDALRGSSLYEPLLAALLKFF